jgi:hypothetical protein
MDRGGVVTPALSRQLGSIPRLPTTADAVRTTPPSNGGPFGDPCPHTLAAVYVRCECRGDYIGSENAGANPAANFRRRRLAAGRRACRRTPRRRLLSSSECRWDYTAETGEVTDSNPVESTLGARSSGVRAPCPAPSVAALAVEAQKAGHLIGNEEMEGAIPSDGSPSCGNSSRVEREVASLEIRVRFPVAAPAECDGDYMVKDRKVDRVRSPRRLREQPKVTVSLVGPCRAANVVGTTCREFESRRPGTRSWDAVVAQR